MDDDVLFETSVFVWHGLSVPFAGVSIDSTNLVNLHRCNGVLFFLGHHS